MKTATINNYLETVTNPGGRFKSLSGLEILRDEGGIPRYAVRSKTLDIAVLYEGKSRVICCPLHCGEALDLRAYVGRKYETKEPRVLLNEMLVFNDHQQSVWQDILLADTAQEIFQPLPTVITKENNTDTRLPEISSFREGLAPAEKKGLYGYVNAEGHTVIPFVYDEADLFDEGLAVVRKNGNFGLIDKQGNEVCPPQYEDIRWRSDNGVVLVCRQGKWSLKNRQGETIHKNTFDFIYDFSEGYASVRREGLYGYINRSGEIVIPPIYEEAYSFSQEGLAMVVKNGISFCIDTEGMVFD